MATSLNKTPNAGRASGDSNSWDRHSSRNVEFKYPPLNQYVSSESFKYMSIPLPNHDKATTIMAYDKKYNVKNEMNAISFSVEGRPCDTSDGKTLVSKSFQLIKDVLKKGYSPDTAVIILKNGSDGTVIQESHIHKCILTGVNLDIDEEGIKLRYDLLGLLENDGTK